MERRERIQELAREQGFALAGIASVPSDGEAPGSDFFLNWIERGLHGPLEYMANSASQRTNLRKRFPWARSVLSVGIVHDGRTAEELRAGEDPASQGFAGQAARGPRSAAVPDARMGMDDSSSGRGRPRSGSAAVPAALLVHVARYARGRDYHLVFEKRLKSLARALVAAEFCERSHWYVDTGPVLERAWAAAAGLGWIGKNTCLIHPHHGSYILLGEIILDAELKPDIALADHCGTCRRCLDACPTGALRAPRELDAARCISTWNLEMKGELPASGDTPLHGWVAGCDVCQSVCPFNAPARLSQGDPELAKANWQELTLAQAILLSRADYNRLFRASALRRVGWRGIRLNAIRAAAQSAEPAVRQALQICLDDPDEDLRREAQRALNNPPPHVTA